MKEIFSMLLLFLFWATLCFPTTIGFSQASAIPDAAPLLSGTNTDACLSPDASLESKSSESDVVLTGTILNMMEEDASEELDRDSRGDRKKGRTASGLVKVWSVMKGSINDVADKSRKYKRFKRSAEKSRRSAEKSGSSSHLATSTKMTKKLVDVAGKTKTGLSNQIIEVHGLWNSYVCGSFLEEGDTRVFFLKKIPDRRGEVERVKRNSKKSRGKKKKRKKGGKKRKRKRNKKKKSKTTPSLSTEWKIAAKSNRRKTTVASVKSMERKAMPHSATSSWSTLLVTGEPSRITLNNLNSIKSLLRV